MALPLRPKIGHRWQIGKTPAGCGNFNIVIIFEQKRSCISLAQQLFGMSKRLVFMVAEKPSLAATLAKILSNNKCSSRKGFNGACSVHEWDGLFKGQNVYFKMTSVCGHVMSLDFTGRYNNWDSVDPVELFTCPTEKKEATPKLKMPAFLSQEAKGSSYLILWLDCDKEGENICFEVINEILHVMVQPNRNEQFILRAKFSAITDKDIKAAMNNLISPNENESRSVDARQEIDLRIGCAFTRFQTRFFQGKYGNLDSTLISYGPCQTPTLGFCVERHDTIKTFQPEPFWVIQVQIQATEYRKLSLEWARVRLFDREVALAFHQKIKDSKYARTINISQKEKVKQRPLALNTVEMMRVASSSLGMSPHAAMLIAERLYTQGFISYPRTETTHYPENFDILGVLKQFRQSADWGADVQNIISQGFINPRKGQDVGDHPPITPMSVGSRESFDHDTWRLYDYIVRHFIGTVSSDCKYLVTQIDFEVGHELFSCSGKRLLDPGYTRTMHWQALSQDEHLPELKPNQMIPVTEVKFLERHTSPPDYLTESELITLMEKHAIGTDASIPVHINNISQRNYVTVGSGRRLIPTALGISLVHGYRRIDPQLVLPTMRSAVEEQLNLIAKGRGNYDEILRHSLEIFRLKFIYFVQHIESMDHLFEDTFSTLSQTGRNFSRCGACRRFMKLVASKPARLHCPNCDATYSLPVGGSFKLFNELKCPLDDFELLLWVGGPNGKGYPFCPYCYVYPPFNEMKKGSGCNMCTHPTCTYGLNTTGVASCSECPKGILVLDLTSGPKWQLACNQCQMVIKICEDANKLSVDDSTCSECDARQIVVEYRQEKTKLPDGQTKSTACIFCSPELSGLVEKRYASNARSKSRRSRGRGRGRGRGRAKPKDKMAQLAAYFV